MMCQLRLIKNMTLNLKNKIPHLKCLTTSFHQLQSKYLPIEGDRNGSHHKHFHKSYRLCTKLKCQSELCYYFKRLLPALTLGVISYLV